MTIRQAPAQSPPQFAFTTAYNGLRNVLTNEVQVTEAFNPNSPPQPASAKVFTGLWDTGATNSVITQKVVDDCQLKPTGMITVHHAYGTDLAETYLVGIALPNRVVFPQVRVTKGVIAGDADLLIGMDIIGTGDFAVTNFAGTTVFSFRSPSVERIDFVKVINDSKAKASTYPKVGRNELCPCGSGKKYKRCHG